MPGSEKRVELIEGRKSNNQNFAGYPRREELPLGLTSNTSPDQIAEYLEYPTHRREGSGPHPLLPHYAEPRSTAPDPPLGMAAGRAAVSDAAWAICLGLADQDSRRRGGDPLAETRRRRNENIRAVARLFRGTPSEQAEQIADRLARFRPMLNETTPERRLLQKIAESGLPVGARQIRKILAHQKNLLEGHGSPRD
jgi:hypothetical protein